MNKPKSKRQVVLGIRLDGHEEHALHAAAKREKLAMSTWARRVLLLAAAALAGCGVARADEVPDFESLIKQVEDSPNAQRVALSAALCANIDTRRGDLRDLAKEQRYDRETGVIRLAVRAKLRAELESADSHAAVARRWLRRIGS